MAIEECNNIPRKQKKKKNLEREASRNGRGGRGESEAESPAGGNSDEETSPRGVLEMLVSGIDEKSGELSNMQWKKMFGQVKRSSSVWRISTISLLGGSNAHSKKALRKTKGRRSNSEDAGDFAMPKPSWRNFSYVELRHATDGFSSENMIGKGGHAEVYKGKLYDGQVVAVKKIMKEEKNDEEKNGDFLAELGIIAHIDHPNAAKLIGFSADQGLYLVLQYLPYGSLTTTLHGDVLA